jgi:hypothetical protein
VEKIVDAELEKGWLQGEVEGAGSQAETWGSHYWPCSHSECPTLLSSLQT